MVRLTLSEGVCPFSPNQPRYTSCIWRMGALTGTFRDFGDLGLVATWGLALFCAPCRVNGVRAEEVLRVKSWITPAIPPGEQILICIWSTISRTDRFPRC